jgi:predicted transcriptional regulator
MTRPKLFPPRKRLVIQIDAALAERLRLLAERLHSTQTRLVEAMLRTGIDAQERVQSPPVDS